MEKQLVTYIARFTWAFMWNQYCINVYCSISFQCKSTQKTNLRWNGLVLKQAVVDLSLRMGDGIFFWLLWVWPPATFIENTYEKKTAKPLSWFNSLRTNRIYPHNFLTWWQPCCGAASVWAWNRKQLKITRKFLFSILQNWTEYHLFYHILLFIAFLSILSIFNCS